MNRCFVGIDTSNYTTSCAACDENGNILANIRIPLPVKEGERGLRQSDAVFAHVRNLPETMQSLRKALMGYETVAVGVSERPRRAEDSYMPCFLSGVAAAESFAAPLNLPVFRFSHQEGILWRRSLRRAHGICSGVRSSRFMCRAARPRFCR